jgi:hypothetical protein
MTATPKQSESIDTYAYFCSEEAEIPLDPEDPAKGTWQPSAYSYSLGQGIEDGFLATYKVHKVRTSVDKNGLQMEDAEVQGAEIYVPENSKLRDIYANQLSLVTLCGLLTDLAEDSEHPRLENVLQGANISAIAGFSLKFRMTQGTTSQRDRDEVKRLAELATHTLCLGTDYLLVFDLTNPERPIAQEIIKEFSNGLQLFKILARLSNVGDDGQSVLREVNIFLERPPSTHPESEEQDDPPLHLLDWLSDGERSFLGRMCLFTLLGETEALILLDEPEVHFNDAWKRQIVSLLDKTIEGRQSHVLITTHSSITLTDVPQEDILVLDRNGSYTSSAFNPGIRTLAANPNDIMKYIFGAPYPSGVRGITYIERVLEGISDLAPATQKKEIENLLDKIGPGYWYSVVQNKLRALERSSEQR